ncbi:hypothetical protein [Candidatus Endoriftia persephone]|jgi:hypothetical protein|uniref:UPF0323 domain-containing protein n=2 Tax=Gammaproteobacteria TaxID=1236 RepID=A0A9J7A0Z1_9GAMM|nr:hypothetical protein [Candidatus Endoriftia persephone]USF88819.1 hypothetical protein L0Y14_06220 [Candidatus Endoriftia persephone]
MKHIKKVLSYSIAGSIGLSVIASLNGCSDQGAPPPGGFGSQAGAEQGQNAFMVIEQTGANPDSYKLVEKHPTTGPNRAILRDMDGNERFLSEDELKQIAEQEAAKVEAGTSRLTEDPSMHSGGMSLGETLLATAAGSLIGGMIANKLMNNSNFQRNQQQYGGGRPTSSISQPYKKTASNKQPKSGFFGGNKSAPRSSNSRFGSFGG